MHCCLLHIKVERGADNIMHLHVQGIMAEIGGFMSTRMPIPHVGIFTYILHLIASIWLGVLQAGKQASAYLSPIGKG